MANTIKTAGTAMIASLAIPVAGISGIGAVGALLGWLFINGNRTSGVFYFFVIALAIFIFTIRFLAKLHKKAQNLVEKINLASNLNLDKSNLLGYPSPVFLSFDQKNWKLATCNTVDNSYEIRDLSSLLNWSIEWDNKNTMEITGMGRRIDGTDMHAPAFENVERRKNFRLVLEVANVNNPILKFYMSERAAIEWCARLNAIING
jgi:hypothetical protein